MINQILGYFSHDIGIDLGTANTLVAVKGKGIVINQPSVVAFNKRTKQILAVGDEAKRMVGKTPANIVAVRPLKDGVISDLEATERMLEYFVKEVHSSSSGFPKIPRPRAVIGIPSGITEVEQRAVLKAAKSAGIRKAYLIEEPMAAAIGSGLPVESPNGNMIIDIGGGTTEIAVISLGGIVVNKSLRVGGDKMDDAIVNYVKNRFNVLIGERKAEDAKVAVGDVGPYEAGKFQEPISGDQKTSNIQYPISRKSVKANRIEGYQDIQDNSDASRISGYPGILLSNDLEATEFNPDDPISKITNSGYYEVRGRHLKTGLPQMVRLSKLDMQQALKEPIDAIVESVKLALEDTPPDLISDILEQGIYLVGGGALLTGLDKLLENKTGIPVVVPEHPELAVVNGTQVLLDNLELLELVHV